MKTLISFVGNICSGKTTITKKAIEKAFYCALFN